MTLVAFSMCWVFRFHMKASKRLTFYESIHTCQIENVFCFAVQTHAKHMLIHSLSETREAARPTRKNQISLNSFR